MKKTVQSTEEWRAVEGSFSVEASLVMAVTLFLIAALLRGAFQIHSEVAGNLVMSEALELLAHQEKDGMGLGQVETEANQELRLYFWCEDGAIFLKESGFRLEGEAGGSLENSISIKKFDPETFLRTLRAVGV